ncbi:MAG: ATP phosphoribosyltransferase regulatory subunit [Eubacteriaceae bacterium]|nr:ATP phosphoribosyltransferase regulatory subunit [Eubacteriaceae bacterium]
MANFSSSVYSASVAALRRLYYKYSCEEAQVPIFVDAALYERYNALSGERYLKAVDRSGNVLVVRPDATFHVLSKTAGLTEPSRIFYTTELIRYNGSVMQEVTQTGAEFFGDPSALCDCEVVSLAIESLLEMGLTEIRVDIGHSGYINSLLSEDESLDPRAHDVINRHIAKKNSIGLADFFSQTSVKAEVASAAIEICMLFGGYSEVLSRAKQLCLNEGMAASLDNLNEIASLLSKRGHGDGVFLDLGFSNWMDYYSGMIFKAYAHNASREVISGGRYDSLAQKLGNIQHASGFGHDLDITLPIAEHTIRQEAAVKCCAPKGNFEQAALWADELRKAGWPAEALESESAAHLRYKEKYYQSTKEFLADWS